MQLIKKVEASYFRSLYSATLNNVSDLNILFGRNDSGKSNLLRVLNLFFNEMTEPTREFDFGLDMSDIRKREAREVRGRQFIWIKVTFNLPQNYQNALGKEITVKRQWNRDEDWNETIFPHLETPGQQARLTRFLNDIDFTYIPAIKDLNVYADLIERMYAAAADTDAIRDATQNFVTTIEGQTTELSNQLSEMFASEARLAPPTEMSRLFRNLDFAHGEDRHSMLRQKGDGIKARHLPELLRYINEKEGRKKLFLWGFEEPENSLDLGAAESEAGRFVQFSKRDDTQIFITSHSPAFYLAHADNTNNISRFFIDKQAPDENGNMTPTNAASKINKWEDAESKMAQAGLLQLPFIIKRMRDQRTLLDKERARAQALRQEMTEIRRPTLFVEGNHDVGIFERASIRAGHQGRINFRQLGGAPNTTEALLGAVLEQGGMSANAPTLFLFDDDKQGRGAFNKLCGGQIGPEPSFYRTNTWAWVLPRTKDFKNFLRRNAIQSDKAFFTAEFLYPAEQSAELLMRLVADYRNDIDHWKENIHGDYWPGLGQTTCYKLAAAEPGSTDWFYSRGVPNGLKQRFIEQIEEDNDLHFIDEVYSQLLTKIQI